MNGICSVFNTSDTIMFASFMEIKESLPTFMLQKGLEPFIKNEAYVGHALFQTIFLKSTLDWSENFF